MRSVVGLLFNFKMTVVSFFLTAVVGQFALAATIGRMAGDEGYVLPVATDEIKIASYNVENLFDTEDDPGKQDATFLPKNHPSKKVECPTLRTQYRAQCFNTDWTHAKLEVKLRNLKAALDAQGPLPDILALSEVENETVARLFAQVLGYRNVIITDGPDERGIDVALMWRPEKVQLAAQKSLLVPGLTTRPILKALFRVRAAQARRVGAELVLFVNHWPSQANPTSERIAAARVVRNEIDNDTKAFGRSYNAIVVGDFNSVENENPHPVGDILLDPKWKNALKDVHELSDRSSNPMNGIMPKGTYNYSGRWNRIDKIVVTAGLADGADFDVIPESFRVVAPAFITIAKGKERIPFRCNHNSADPRTAGYSDHFPIVVKLKLPR